MLIKSDFGVLDTRPFISMGKHDEVAVIDLISNPAVAGSKDGYIHLNIVFKSSKDMAEAYYAILFGLNKGMGEVSISGLECHWDWAIVERLQHLAAGMGGDTFKDIPWTKE